MEVKHQVFVSSTFKDLIEERKEVMHALLELDCIPAGMELFPASDEDAWSLIQEVIDGCDYYILILAGKYGSTNADGISYTEMEYDYAISQGKPILSFLHEDLDSLTGSKIEKSDAARAKLETFRSKTKERHCKFWSSALDLGGKVSRSMVQLKKKHPSDGWVPGKYAADQKMFTELARLRARVVELEAEAADISALPANLDELEHGRDLYGVLTTRLKGQDGKTQEVVLKASWDTIFSYCGPSLSGECSGEELLKKVQLVYFHATPEDLQKRNNLSDVVIPYVCEDQIKVQLQALGLIQNGTKRRAVSDKNTYWKLTPYGEKYLIQVKALRRGEE